MTGLGGVCVCGDWVRAAGGLVQGGAGLVRGPDSHDSLNISQQLEQ